MKCPNYVGARTITTSGNSIVVSLPDEELREHGVAPEDLKGETVMCVLDDEGFHVDLEDELASEPAISRIDAD